MTGYDSVCSESKGRQGMRLSVVWVGPSRDSIAESWHCCLLSNSHSCNPRSRPPLHPNPPNPPSLLNRAIDSRTEFERVEYFPGVLGSKNIILEESAAGTIWAGPTRAKVIPDHLARHQRTICDHQIAFRFEGSSSQDPNRNHGELSFALLERADACGRGNPIRPLLFLRVGASCGHQHRISRDDVCR